MPLPELGNSPEQYRQSADVIERPSGEDVESATVVEVVEWSPGEQSPDGQGRLEDVATRVGAAAGEAVSTLKDTVSSAKESATNMYREARSTARAGYSQASEAAQELMRATAKNAKVAREQYPLQSLAVLAGIGFAIGIALRIWRSYGSRNA